MPQEPLFFKQDDSVCVGLLWDFHGENQHFYNVEFSNLWRWYISNKGMLYDSRVFMANAGISRGKWPSSSISSRLLGVPREDLGFLGFTGWIKFPCGKASELHFLSWHHPSLYTPYLNILVYSPGFVFLHGIYCLLPLFSEIVEVLWSVELLPISPVPSTAPDS